MSFASPTLALIADVGGTNARFALTDPATAAPEIIEPRSLATAKFASLQHAAEHYLAELGANPDSAAIAVASPVHGEEIRLTNRAWSFTRRELKQALGLRQLSVINDFGAVSWAIPALQPHEYVTLHGRDDAPLVGPVSVIGPGTGLGVALLVGDAQRGWNAVETEGGHVSFAPLGEEELMIARWLTARFGRVSTERVLSGAGLSYIDAILRSDGNAPHDVALRDPAEIVAAALEGHDVSSRRALARFCAVLGSVVGDAGLIHGARTVMIAGGMVPRFIPFLRSSAFRERLLAKGRFVAYLESMTIRVITHPHPGLLGAAVAARAAQRASQ
ncbi:glucokinase [Lysobacter solisilvae (ex Woo and Kim 2020)]|uniref:Glucokinase n=1 Tax=Agrilutibacter terrestris TaxID=2865112 RepID=A0A7H0FU63_9GAMM|nr:glucokinase [Lysobacter terrestris]QNP39579.1 glucokinase [Lysobacter terrestris]